LITEPIMADGHIELFRQAARPGTIHPAGLWILVRRTKPASLAYIGRPNHWPKPGACQAKSADRDGGHGRYKHAGLVVDPTLSPDSFTKIDRAREYWARFINEHRPAPWGVDAAGRSLPLAKQPPCCVNNDATDTEHFGCLLFENRYLHGDYDLYAIFRPDRVRANLAGVGGTPDHPTGHSPYLRPLQTFINSRIGVPMVQHGAQEAGYGHIEEETVDIFAPDGGDDEMTVPSKEFPSIVDWYAAKAPGRQAIDLSTGMQGRPTGQPGWRPRLV
jgi:hypothetical protein